MSFEYLGVPARACETLRKQGITTPNAVQENAIPPLMRGTDGVIQAPTGSGKTLAYLLPLVDRLKATRQDGPRALIVAPTRELATQIDTVLRGLHSGLRSALVFGGVAYGNQLRALRQRPDVVIGCPGRLLDLAAQRAFQLSRVEYLVLDEADEMLDQGFAKDVEKIIAMTPASRQTVLASATVPDWVQTMIDKHLREPEFIRVVSEVEPSLDHGLLAVNQTAKIDTLHKLLSRERGQTIVFHRTKHGAKKLARDLNRLGHSAGELQGNLSQNARDRAMASFRSGRSSVLVATNVAARGIDVADVGLVVNFELPETAEWLTHRIGRTARNGAHGRALTFVTPEDGVKWTKLRRQGAPDLAHVHADKLLDDGEWSFQPHEPRTSHVSSRPNHRVTPSATDARPAAPVRRAQGGGWSGPPRARGPKFGGARSGDRPNQEGGYPRDSRSGRPRRSSGSSPDRNNHERRAS